MMCRLDTLSPSNNSLLGSKFRAPVVRIHMTLDPEQRKKRILHESRSCMAHQGTTLRHLLKVKHRLRLAQLASPPSRGLGGATCEASSHGHALALLSLVFERCVALMLPLVFELFATHTCLRHVRVLLDSRLLDHVLPRLEMSAPRKPM